MENMEFYRNLAHSLYDCQMRIGESKYYEPIEFLELKHNEAPDKGKVFYKKLIEAMPFDARANIKRDFFLEITQYCSSKLDEFKKPPPAISFNGGNYKFSFKDWNEKNNNALNDWIKTGQMLKIEDWHYMEKGNFQNIEKQLSEYLKILDVNIVNLNSGMDKEIRYYCNVKENRVKQILKQYFSHITNQNTFVMPFHSLCGRIIQQPVYILDAIEKYPDTLSKEQIIYHRYNFIHGKIESAKDKFIEFNVALNRLFNFQLAKGEDNKPLLNLFIFTDQFIDELKYFNSTGVKYFETPLFIEFFNSILSYKKKYISVFNEFAFDNIIEIETMLNNLKTVPPEPIAKPKEKLSDLITHKNSVTIVENIKIQYRNIKGKRLKLLLMAFQSLGLLPKERIAQKFHNCCKNEFEWKIASYNAMNGYDYNEMIDIDEFNEMKQYLKTLTKTN